MKTIKEVYSSLVSPPQSANFGFKNLNNYFSGSGHEISIFFLSSSIIEAVIKQIEATQVSSLDDLGKKHSFIVFDEVSWKECLNSPRLDVAAKFKELSKRSQENKVSSIILITDTNAKWADIVSFEVARVCTFMAEILSPELEMIILKNRYRGRGKVQLNINNQSVLELLNFKTQKYNGILGDSRGLKTTVMHAIIKNKLDEGKSICYNSFGEDVRTLLRNLLGVKQTDDVTPELVTKLESMYGSRLFFNPDDADEIPEDVILFIDSDLYFNAGSRISVKSKEIWFSCTNYKKGRVNFLAVAQELGLKEGESVEYLNVIVNNEKKIILETMDGGKGFWLDRNHRVSPDLFVNMNSYESLLFLGQRVQILNHQISQELDAEISKKLNQQREEIVYRIEAKLKNNPLLYFGLSREQPE